MVSGFGLRVAELSGLSFATSGFGVYSRSSWNIALGGLVLGSLILYLKGMRIMMFQLSGFYCRVAGSELDCGFLGWIAFM